MYLLSSDWAAIGVGEAAEEVREVVLVKFCCQGVVEGDVHNLSFGSFRFLLKIIFCLRGLEVASKKSQTIGDLFGPTSNSFSQLSY